MTMHFNEKLNEAKYYFRLLESAPQDSVHEKEFMYILSAFLCSWRSVLDVCLYDYAEKYNLGFTRDDSDLNPTIFKIVARATRNTSALEFIDWLNQQMGVFSINSLMKKRNIIVHRGYPDISRSFSLFLSDSVLFSGSVSILASFFVNNPNPAGSFTSNPPSVSPQAPVPLSSPSVEIRFQDSPNESVIESCRSALTQMEVFVTSLTTRFGT
ncbi:MAG: hypothetical protein NTV61_06145 [Candidatus Bathyarchaeota archaeon]|nr:hypothetical protein [Candidatus Bathyarchaeota archaeon]